LILGVLLHTIYGIVIFIEELNKDFDEEEIGEGVGATFFITIMTTIKDGFMNGLISTLKNKPYSTIDNRDVANKYWLMWAI